MQEVTEICHIDIPSVPKPQLFQAYLDYQSCYIKLDDKQLILFQNTVILQSIKLLIPTMLWNWKELAEQTVIQNEKLGFIVCMRGSKGGGDMGFRSPPKKSQNIGFPSNTGPDPLKNHKATKPDSMLGLHWQASEMPFKWPAYSGIWICPPPDILSILIWIQTV